VGRADLCAARPGIEVVGAFDGDTAEDDTERALKAVGLKFSAPRAQAQQAPAAPAGDAGGEAAGGLDDLRKQLEQLMQ